MSKEYKALKFVEELYQQFYTDIRALQTGDEPECIGDAMNIVVEILENVAKIIEDKQ